MSNVIKFEDTDIELIDGDRGVNYPSKSDFFENGYCLFLDAGNITENGFNFSNTHFITKEKDEKLRNGKLQRNDIVMMTRGSVGNIAIYDDTIPYENVRINSGMIIIRCHEKYHALYLYYVLKSSFVKKQINDIMSGSVQKQLPASIIKSLMLFAENEKKYNGVKIVQIIDSKIENNNKINAELESMAKTIYDYWFLQFEFPNEEGKPYKSSGGKMVWNEELKREIPDGWEVSYLSELCDFNNGINYDKDELGDKDYSIINVRNITSSTLLLDKSDFDIINLKSSQADKYLVEKDDILIARSGTPGAVRLLESDIENIIYCGFIIRCKPLNPVQRYYLAYSLKLLEGSNATKTGGSIMQNVSQDTLKQINICIPNDDVIEKYNKSISVILSKMQNVIEENRELTSLRDFLLPMLMNGQVGFKINNRKE